MVQRVDLGISDRQTDELLFSLGEELKAPLVSIRQLAEMGGKDPMVQALAHKALNTIDSVLLYKRIVSGQLSMKLEPVHVGGTMHDVAQMLEPLMRMSGCSSQIAVTGQLRPVDVDRRLLNGALISMWQALIGSMKQPSGIVCTAKKVPGGIRMSVMSDAVDIDAITLSAANGSSTQPVTAVAGPAADLLAAQSMFSLAGSVLGKAAAGSMQGFGVTLPVSKQLALL